MSSKIKFTLVQIREYWRWTKLRHCIYYNIMRLISVRELKVDTKIKQSAYSVVMGFVILAVFSTPIFLYFYNPKILGLSWQPIFLIALSTFFIFLIQIRYVKNYFNPNKFLMGFNGSEIILNMNHMIKEPEPENDLYLGLGPGSDFSHLEFVKETKMTSKSIGNRTSNEIRFSRYLEFHMNNEIDESFIQTLIRVSTSSGFQGSPIVMKKNIIEYHLDGNILKVRAITNLLVKRGLFSGRFREVDSTDKQLSPDELYQEVMRLKQLGSSIKSRQYLRYIEQNNLLSDDKINELKKIS